MGGVPKFGFWYDQDGKVHKNKYEQNVIKGVAKMREQGINMGKIAKYYSEKGVLNRAGKPISRQQIRRIVEKINAERSDT